MFHQDQGSQWEPVWEWQPGWWPSGGISSSSLFEKGLWVQGTTLSFSVHCCPGSTGDSDSLDAWGPAKLDILSFHASASFQALGCPLQPRDRLWNPRGQACRRPVRPLYSLLTVRRRRGLRLRIELDPWPLLSKHGESN